MRSVIKIYSQIHSLDTLAENLEVEICTTLDGAKFANHMSYVTCDMKVIDVRAIDQKNDLLVNFQIRELSFVFECHLMKDGKEGHAFSRIF